MMQAASRQRVEEAIAPLQFSSPFISQVVPPAVEPSTARPSLPPLMTDRSVQRVAWHTLIKEQAARGSVYTFLTSGNADIAAPEVPTAVNNSASSLSSFASPPTLRRLLRRLDSPREADNVARTSQEALPRVLWLDSPKDPVVLGLVAPLRAQELVAYFVHHCSPWLGVITDLSITARSPLVHTAILYHASRFGAATWEETSALATHVRTLAIMAFAEGDSSILATLGLYLASIWKSPDDQLSDLHVGFAGRIAAMHSSSFANTSGPEAREKQRILYFHYVQQNVFFLHYTPLLGVEQDQCTMPSVYAWSGLAEADPLATGDWMLGADVTSTHIQCRYKAQLRDRSRKGHQDNAASLMTVLDSLLDEMREWEAQWLSAAHKHENAAALSGATLKREDRQIRELAFAFFRGSVLSHISSIILREALRYWLPIGKNDAPKPWSSAAFRAVSRSYEVCLNATQTILDRTATFGSTDVSGASDAAVDALLHMPDSLLLLLDHSALLAVYLLLLPSTAAAVTEAAGEVYPGYSSDVTTLCDLSQSVAAKCLDRIIKCRTVLERASCNRPGLHSAASLSADYLDSLVAMMQGVCLPHADPSVVQGPSGVDGIDLPTAHQLDDQLEWDWLQSFIDFSQDRAAT